LIVAGAAAQMANNQTPTQFVWQSELFTSNKRTIELVTVIMQVTLLSGFTLYIHLYLYLYLYGTGNELR